MRKKFKSTYIKHSERKINSKNINDDLNLYEKVLSTYIIFIIICCIISIVNRNFFIKCKFYFKFDKFDKNLEGIENILNSNKYYLEGSLNTIYMDFTDLKNNKKKFLLFGEHHEHICYKKRNTIPISKIILYLSKNTKECLDIYIENSKKVKNMMKKLTKFKIILLMIMI